MVVQNASKLRAKRWSLAAAMFIVLTFFLAMTFKRGALAGTYDANYRARLSMLARDPGLREEGGARYFPELAKNGGDFVELDDLFGTPIWQSAGLAGTGRRLDRSDRMTLTECILPDGKKGWSVKVAVRYPDGSRGVATYGGSMRGYYADLTWLVGWLAGVFVLPALLLTIVAPSFIRRETPAAGNGLAQ
jgi:hypothetical protein